MKHQSDIGCIDCIGVLGCLIGFGCGIWGSIYVGKEIVSAMPDSAYPAAVILAIIAALSITPLATSIGNCFGKCLGGSADCCIIGCIKNR